jgi:ribosome-binding protein aMBF1 (putative translation factor)
MPRKPNTALIYQRIPDHLRAMRESVGLTQRALADRLKKPQSWVARCETAARRVDVAEWIEWCYGCGMDAEAALADLVQKRH